jgi:hypothetical protein
MGDQLKNRVDGFDLAAIGTFSKHREPPVEKNKAAKNCEKIVNRYFIISFNRILVNRKPFFLRLFSN